MSAPMNSDQAARFFDEWVDDGVTVAHTDRLRKICLQLVMMIAKASPVDTGRFRGSWETDIDRFAFGSAPLGEAGTSGNAGAATRASTQRAASILATIKKKIPKFVGITNVLPYARRLEYEPGFTKKAEPGFVRAQVAAMKSHLRAGKIR